jgi:hypothetical protein
VTGCFKWAAWCLILCFYAISVLEASTRLRSAENARFEIVGLDPRSVSYVDDLSRHLVEVATRYLDPASLEFSQRILIRLKPEDYVDFAGDYEIRIEPGGFVSLDLRWTADLNLRTANRAISEALLVRYAIFNHGPDAVEALPDWPGAAIGTQSYLSLRPAEFLDLRNWLDLSATPSLASVLDRKWTNAADDANGYGLLLGLERSGLDRRAIRSLMAQAISGSDIFESLLASIQPSDPKEESIGGDQWWERTKDAIVEEDLQVLESMEISRDLIVRISDMSHLGEGVNLRSLWQMKEDEKIRSLIKARYEILRIRLARLNPAYFNSATALGALFETLLYGERSHEYVHQLAIFLSEFEDMKQLERVVKQALGK